MGKKSQKKFNQDASLICQGVAYGLEFEIHISDIFMIKAEVIVNPANKRLDHIGGLAAQISQKAGPEFQKHCLKECPRGLDQNELFTTPPFDLKNEGYKWIINAVGEIYDPRIRIDFQNSKLKETVYKCFIEANRKEAKSISLPAISCGIFNYPKDMAAKCHFEGFIYAARKIENIRKHLKVVKFVMFQDEEAELFSSYFLNNSQLFSEFKYFGLLSKRKGKKYNLCKACKNFYKKKFFSLISCCASYCNFCVFQYNLKYCISCNTIPENFNTEGIIWCRECLQEVELTKKTIDRTCKRCNSICYYHYIPKGNCIGCHNPYS